MSRWPLRFPACGLLAIGLVALLVLQGCETTEKQRRLTAFVEELIFGGPYDASVPQDALLHRWNSEILVFVFGPGSREHRADIVAEVNAMAALAGLSGRAADRKVDANLVVELRDEESFIIRREFANCYASFKTEQHTIVSVEIAIGIKGEDSPKHCLAHELMHGVGFPNHSGIVRSVLSPVHQEIELTAWDRIAIEVLYDQRLQTGMTRETARPIIDRIIEEQVGTP